MAATDEYRWQNTRERLGFPEPAVTERCAFCSFSVSAPLEQAREAFAEHLCDRPKAPTTVRRRSGFALKR